MIEMENKKQLKLKVDTVYQLMRIEKIKVDVYRRTNDDRVYEAMAELIDLNEIYKIRLKKLKEADCNHKRLIVKYVNGSFYCTCSKKLNEKELNQRFRALRSLGITSTKAHLKN